MDTQSLLSDINPDELTVFAPTLSAWRHDLLNSEDQVAQFMVYGGPMSPTASAGGPPSQDKRPDRRYWDAVKEEMHTFLCTDDKRYKDLWKRISDLESRSTTTLVGLIAAYLGSVLGAPATLLTGFIAVCLYGMIKIGKEAYCRQAGQ